MWPNGSCQGLSHLKLLTNQCGGSVGCAVRNYSADRKLSLLTQQSTWKKRSFVGNLVRRKEILLASSRGVTEQKVKNLFVEMLENFYCNT